MASINFEANNNPIEGKSHVILRTNPLLSSNVKLVVDSKGEIYLDSINANRTLSDQRYKKFNLDRSGHYAYDIASFYAATPYNTIYEPLRRDSDLSVYREYRKQYEEQYQYGARLNGSKDFDENIRFMAPLWIDEKLPEYFVVYRIEEPISESVLSDDLYGINSRLMDMLSNATIVKTFDLRKGSIIGDYLETFANDPKRPVAPLTVSFEQNEKTSWNGIDVRKGGFASKGEYIYKDFTEDRVEILNNEFITNGFKRNQLISANLINLEFLFEDFDNAYDVNRYIGIYVNAHEEGSFKHVKYTKNILHIDANTFKTNFDLDGTGLSDLDMLPTAELQDPTLNWVKSGNSFGHIKNIYNSTVNSLKLNVNAFNIDESKYIKKSDSLTITNFLDNANDFIEITIFDNPMTSDRFIVGATSDIRSDAPPFTSFVIEADSALSEGTASGHRFSNNGALHNVAKAMKAAILNVEDIQINVKVNGSELILTNYKTGNRTYSMVFGSYKTNSNTVSVRALNDDINQRLNLDPALYARYDIWTGTGGSYDNAILVSETEVGDIDTNTLIKSGNKFIKIVEIVEDPYFAGYYRVCLNQSLDRLKIKDINLPLYVENDIKIGKFEAFDFHDFDYNFYSTRNSDLGEIQYEIDYDIDGVVDEYDPITGEYIGQLKTNVTGDYARLEGVKNPVTPISSGITQVNSEYDRLQENYNTELALTSRIIPTINKWKYFEGTNAKEMPYMLTTSEAFGKTNFAPDIEVSGRSISDMTHEWYYLYKHPNYSGVTLDSDVAEMVRKLTSYIQPETDINLETSNLTDVNNNYFDRLFTYEGYDVTGAGFAPAGPTNKFVKLRGGSTQAPAEALFRGLKVKLYERKEFNETNPRNLITSTSFNGYRFTAVLNYNNNQTSNDVQIKAIQNKKFKFVCLYIEVNSTEDSIASLNRELLYKLKDVFTSGSVDNTEINGYISFDIQQDTDGKYADGIGVGTKLARDIQLDDDGGYNRLFFDYSGITWELPVVSVSSNNSIRVACDNYVISEVNGGSNTLNITGLTEADWSNITFIYEGGGRNLAASLMRYVSTKNIVDLLNNNDTESIEYLTVEEDGTINPNRFIINVEDGNKILKTSKLIPVSDPVKPDSYKVSSGVVGYIVVNREDQYKTELIRMSGHYTPLSRPVVSFTDLYQYYKTTQIEDSAPLTIEEQREKLLYNRYNRTGIAFASYVNRGQYKYGLIEDMFYHKVNPEKADGILKLSNSTGTQPRYPLIDEVAITKRDVNVFRSSWEDEFYVKNGSKQTNVNVYGTLSTYEESAFLASTLNLPKNQYEITTYDVIETKNTLNDLKDLKSTGNFTGDIVQFEDADRIYADIYLNNLLVDLLEADNAGRSIERFVIASQSYGDKTSLKDDVRNYIEVNLLKLMNIDDIKVYSKDDKNIAKSEVLSAENLNDILDSGFTESKDFRIEYDNTNALNLRLIYNKRAGFRHKLYIYIKIRS